MERNAQPRKESLKLKLHNILAIALLGVSMATSIRPVSAGEPPHEDSCSTVIFHFPAEGAELPEDHITNKDVDLQVEEIDSAATAFAEGLDDSLNFSALDTANIGFAQVCNEADTQALIQHGATDIEENRYFETSDLEVTQGEYYPDEGIEAVMHTQVPFDKGMTGTRSELNTILLDTGVDVNHPDLQGYISHIQKCISYTDKDTRSSCPNGQNEDDSAHIDSEEFAHGTMMAGYMRTTSGGKIVPIQMAVWGTDAKTQEQVHKLSNENILRSYDWIVKSNQRYAAVNNSYGGGRYTSIDRCIKEHEKEAELIDNIVDKGIAFIAASGNDGGLNFTNSPACLDKVIGVGSSNIDDTMANHSDIAPWIRLVAPGTLVTTTYPKDQHALGTGTSASAALVTGAVQVARDMYPSMTPDQIKDLLIRTGIPVVDNRRAEGGFSSGQVTRRVDMKGITWNWLGDLVRANPADKVFLPAVRR